MPLFSLNGTFMEIFIPFNIASIAAPAIAVLFCQKVELPLPLGPVTAAKMPVRSVLAAAAESLPGHQHHASLLLRRRPIPWLTGDQNV